MLSITAMRQWRSVLAVLPAMALAIIYGGVAVDSMRMISARQALHGSAAPAMDLRAPWPGSLLRANFGNTAAGDKDGAQPSLGPRGRKGSLAMRASSGRRNGRRRSSDMLRSVPMMRDQLEASARGQERAARARKEQQEAAQRLSAATTTVAKNSDSSVATYAATSTTAGASISTVATAAATAFRLPSSAVDNDVIVRDVPVALKWERGNGGAPGGHDSDVISATAGKIQSDTGLTDKVNGGSPSPPGNEGTVNSGQANASDNANSSGDGNGKNAGVTGTRKGRRRTGNSGQAVSNNASGSGEGNGNYAGVTGTRKGRRRRKPTPAVPVGRAEAVQLLRDAVTRFRAAQISDGGGGSETPTSDGLSSSDGELVHADKNPRTVAAVEFAEIAHRCLGSGLPEIALEAYSLYVRAAASGQAPVIMLLRQPATETSTDSITVPGAAAAAPCVSPRDEAETALLVTAARSHVAMGGVLDGLALLDDAAGLGGLTARARGKWGGDGEAGAGAALLEDQDASVLVEQLCVSGGDVGLRAALRLKERLADEKRVLSREANLLLLEALAGATGRGLGVVSEATGRGLTFPEASTAEPDPAWFEILRENARRAWGSGIAASSGEADIEERRMRIGGKVGSGWVPTGARATPGDGIGVGGAGETGGSADVDGEGALVPPLSPQVAARMAEELFAEMAGGKEAGRVSSRAQASLVRAVFRSTLSRARGPAPPAPPSDLADRTSATFDEGDVEVALWAGQAAANRFKIKNKDKNKNKPKCTSSTSAAADTPTAAATLAVVANPGKFRMKPDDKATGNTVNPAPGKASPIGAPATGASNRAAGGRRNANIKPTDGEPATGGDAVNSDAKGEAGSVRRSAAGPIKKDGMGKGGKGGGSIVQDRNARGVEGGFWAASTLLQECLACKYTAGAEIVLESMEKAGHWARTSTFNTLLWYFRQERDAKGALEILRCLRESETVSPNKLSFTLAIQACVWSGSCMEEAWSVVEQAEQAEVCFASKDLLDARLILVQAVGGDVFEGLEDMATRGVAPDEGTLLGVIEACAERGDTNGALQILEMMRGARGTGHAASTGANSRRSVCPRPSYRSYVAALTACSRAPVVLPSTSVGDDASTKADAKRVGIGGGMGDWEASKRVLGMMWEDEAARKAEGQAAVPGSWSLLLQEALSLGPSNVTMPAVPDAACYQLAMECCVARGRTDQALSLLSEMEGRGLSPNEAGLRALIRGFASEGGRPGVGGAGGEAESAELRWRGVERALGVFEELAERFHRPSRASFESAIDACVSHPDGLQAAGKLITRMKEAGHDLGAEHYNVLIRGFGDARNLGAALDVFQEMRDGVAVVAPGGGGGSSTQRKSLGYEVDEDTFAALLGACTRSGEADNVSEAIGFLRMNGVNPPQEILNYLQNDEVESELYDMIFGENDRKAGKNREKKRGRKYGTSALAMHFVEAPGDGGAVGREVGRGVAKDGGVHKKSNIRHDGTRVDGDGKGRSGAAAAVRGQKTGGKALTFAESVRERLCRLEEKQLKAAIEVEETFPHPVGWVGTYTEVLTHSERKEEALKRKAGEARSRERREKRLRDKAAANGESPSAEGGTTSRRATRSSERRRRFSRRSRRDGSSQYDDNNMSSAEAEERLRNARPLLVKVRGMGSMSEESSPAVDAVVAGLRRKGKIRGRAPGEGGAPRRKNGADDGVEGVGLGRGGGDGGIGEPPAAGVGEAAEVKMHEALDS